MGNPTRAALRSQSHSRPTPAALSLRNILSIRPAGSPASVALFSSYSPDQATATSRKPIADPYYGGMRGFEGVYAQCVEYSRGFLDALERGRLGEGETETGGKRAGL